MIFSSRLLKVFDKETFALCFKIDIMNKFNHPGTIQPGKGGINEIPA